MVYIVELDGLKPFRDFRIPSADHVYCQNIIGFDHPCIALVHDDAVASRSRTAFYDPHGRMREGSPIDMSFEPKALFACPDKKRILGLASDPNVRQPDPETVAWGIFVIDDQRNKPFTVLPDVIGVFRDSGIPSLETGMFFYLFWMRQKCELIAVRLAAEGVEIAYRVTVPKYSALAGTPDGRCATLLVVRDGRLEIIRLGITPPSFAPVESLPQFRLPCLPQLAIAARHFECHLPTGTQKAAVDAVEVELIRLGKSRYKEKIQKIMKKSDADELLALDFALQRVHEAGLAGKLSAHISKLHPHHPRVKLHFSRTLANVGRWQDILTLLKDIDPKSIDPAEVKHLHHMRGISLMMLAQPDAAIVEFEISMKFEEGPCLVEELLALCLPLSGDEHAWGAESLLLRNWLRCVESADEALARGDAGAARRTLDIPLIWEAHELQSFARLTQAYLDEGETGSTTDTFRKALALLGFCDLFDARKTLNRRDIPLPRATWSDEKLNELARRASRWVDETFGKKQD